MKIEKSFYHKKPITLAHAILSKFPLGFLMDCISNQSLIATAYCEPLDSELPLFPSDMLKSKTTFSKGYWNLHLRNKFGETLFEGSNRSERNSNKDRSKKLVRLLPDLFDGCFLIDINRFDRKEIIKIRNIHKKNIIDITVTAGNGPFMMTSKRLGFFIGERVLNSTQIYLDELALGSLGRPSFYIDDSMFLIKIDDQWFDLSRNEKTRIGFKVFWLIHQHTKDNPDQLLKRDRLMELLDVDSLYEGNALKKIVPKDIHALFDQIVISKKNGYRLRFYNKP